MMAIAAFRGSSHTQRAALLTDAAKPLPAEEMGFVTVVMRQHPAQHVK